MARIRATRGRALARLGRYGDAAAELEAAYFAARELDDDASAAIAVELAAVLGDKMGRLDDARVWARHAETALASIGGPEGETHARLLLAVAAADLRRGDFEGSRRSAERALALRRELHGDEHPGVALAELGLGKALAQLGRLDDAAACFERALAILERALGPEHIDLAGAYHDLGLVSTQRGDFSTARTNEERALAIRQLWLPPDHPDIATALVGLSYVDLGLQRYDDAVMELERALAIREAKFGQTHPAVAATLAALAQVASKRGDCREAIGFLERALAVSERADAGDRRARVRFTLGLADALSECHEHDAARRQYEAARALAEAEPNGFGEELDRARRGLAAVMGG